MQKWKYNDVDTICDCGEQTPAMDHLLKCLMPPQKSTIKDVMEYNKAAKECVFQWMKQCVVARQEEDYSITNQLTHGILTE